MNLKELSEVDPRTVDRSTLVQRDSVHLDPEASDEERYAQYLSQIKNPYCFLDGKTVIKLSYTNNGRTIEDCVVDYLNGV